MAECLLTQVTVTAIVATAAFAFGVYRYFDARRRERSDRRFDQFHRVLTWVAGRTSDGVELVDVQQAAAVCELIHFPEYAHVSLRILDYYIAATGDEPDDALFRSSVIFARQFLDAATARRPK